MRIFILICLLMFGFAGNSFAITWDLTDQDCDAFDLDWAKTENGNATITVETEDGRSCWKFYTPGVNADDYGICTNSNVVWDSDCTIEVVFKIDQDIDDAHKEFSVYTRDTNRLESAVLFNFDSADYDFPSARMGVWHDAAWEVMESYIDISTTTWHTLRIVIDDDYMSAWVDGYLIYADLGPNNTPVGAGYTPDLLGFIMYSSQISVAKTFFVDSVKMSSETVVPAVVTPLNIYGENIVVQIAQDENFAGWVDASPLRFYKTGCTYQDGIIHQIPLLAIGTDWASGVRVYTGAETKALMKLPT